MSPNLSVRKSAGRKGEGVNMLADLVTVINLPVKNSAVEMEEGIIFILNYTYPFDLLDSYWILRKYHFELHVIYCL